MSINNSKAIIIFCLILMFHISCTSSKKVIKYTKRTIPPYTSIAVIIDSPNNLKNVVLAKFMSKGYTVKAVNASDLYSLNEIFDIKDFKRMSYIKGNDSFVSLEKTYNNIYKLHIYNFEVNKAEMLSEMRNKWDVQYLVLLDLKDWENVSWGRAIDLKTNEIIWIENYATSYSDTIESVIEHFITSMSNK